MKIIFCNITGNNVITYFDLPSNPFKIGDTLNVSISDIDGKVRDFPPDLQEKIKDTYFDLYETYNFKKLYLHREAKYIEFNNLSEPIITIEYYCEVFKD